MSAHLFIGAVRDGGYYIAIDGTVLGERPDTAELITSASRSLAGLHGGEGTMSGDEQAYGEQVASLTVLDGGVVLRKRGDGFVKLRYAETPPILSARYGESRGRSLETTPARVTPLEVIGVTNNPGLCAKRLPHENRIPETSVLEYRDVCIAPRQVLVKDHLLLPNTSTLPPLVFSLALFTLRHAYRAPFCIPCQLLPKPLRTLPPVPYLLSRSLAQPLLIRFCHPQISFPFPYTKRHSLRFFFLLPAHHTCQPPSLPFSFSFCALVPVYSDP